MQKSKKIKKTKKLIRRKATRKRCVCRAQKSISKRTPFGKGLIKLVALVTIISLNWFGLAAIGETFAYFNDAETSSANALTAGTLDFSLISGAWSGGEPYNLLPGGSVTKTISILDIGNLGFRYRISVVKNSGDDDFCNALQLTADIDGGATEYSNVLIGAAFGNYTYSNPDAWTFTVSLPGSSPEFTETGCDFDFVFEGWQTGLAFGQGFSDIENDNNYLSATSKYSPIADSNIRQDTPDTNYGTGANLRVRSESGGNRRSFIKFNFNFPGGTTLLSANLKLYMYDAPATSRTYEISSSSADWTESTITWNNAPPVASLPTGTAAISTTDGQWISFDVTSDLQAFFDGTDNYGWQIRDASEDSGISPEALFYSKDSADPSLKPVLEVAFRSPAQNPGYAVINEVYLDVGSGKGTDPENEWVEIFNPTGLAIDISNWQICDNISCDTIPALSPEIPSRGFAVIARDITTWAQWTNIPAGAIKIELGSNIGNGLANAGDRVILKDNLGAEIDAMSYGTDTSKLDPAPPAPGQGYSLARIVKGWDNNVANDWVVSVTPNPGTNPSDEDGVEIMRFTDAGIEVAAASQGLEPLVDGAESLAKNGIIDEPSEIQVLEPADLVCPIQDLTDGSEPPTQNNGTSSEITAPVSNSDESAGELEESDDARNPLNEDITDSATSSRPVGENLFTGEIQDSGATGEISSASTGTDLNQSNENSQLNNDVQLSENSQPAAVETNNPSALEQSEPPVLSESETGIETEAVAAPDNSNSQETAPPSGSEGAGNSGSGETGNSGGGDGGGAASADSTSTGN